MATFGLYPAFEVLLQRNEGCGQGQRNLPHLEGIGQKLITYLKKRVSITIGATCNFDYFNPFMTEYLASL